MTERLKYITPNQWHHRQYNRYCYRRLKKTQVLYTDPSAVSSLTPIFVTGFFRSGTSLTTRLLHALGVDLGPEHHLLQGKKTRAALNPDGFYENYLFMETSLYAFHRLDAWGHIPPAKAAVEKLSFDEKDREVFSDFTLCEVHDDRISNKNKMDVLRQYDLLALDTYLRQKFSFPFAVKNPHFAVLSAWLLKKWPGAKFLVCFRQPAAALASTNNMSGFLNETLYEKYYRDLLTLPAENVVFFSYDHLLVSPASSLEKLAQQLGLEQRNVASGAQLVDPGKQHFKSEPGLYPDAEKTHAQLLQRAINV